jgi:hypothetical protein
MTLGHLRLPACVAVFLATALLAAQGFAQSERAIPQGAQATTLEQFAGEWDYNDEESVNAGTGRREQAPQSATQRGGTAAGGAQGPGRGGGGRGSGGGDGGGFGGRQSGVVGPTPDMIRENRSAQRDLLEIAESLTIAVKPGVVTFTDDLGRTRTYPTDGTRQRYMLGSARYEARVRWDGTQLRKEIDAAFGLKVTETYFLSPDGRRLFLIVRLGEQRENVRPVGANRVYDRVE